MAKVQEDLKTINENINQKFENIEVKTKELEQKLEQQQMHLDRLDQQLKKRNIIIFGLEEQENYYSQLEEIVLDLLNKVMKIPCDQRDIESVKRLGKKKGNVRPVVVTLTTMGLKLKVLRSKNLLKNTRVYLKEDFTPKILQKRKELQEEFLSRREKGENVVIKYDKIITLNRKSPLLNKTRALQESPKHKHRNNKRKPPASPDALPETNQPLLNNNTRKKNKTSIESYMTPKPTLPITTSSSSQNNITNSIEQTQRP
ncbi:uncharacterized protein LOC128198873 [Bicyclus anynana]|uniref:Uncharacterized protein LOC128198873 n=1 Tax=Bicyclus anynana TaxID=110368 RepID=A0ABM3LTA3_BICAN|nr:uncharacterized protein LOC128198873 [Bicyclus anynana]